MGQRRRRQAHGGMDSPLRKIQEARKLVFTSCDKTEVETLVKELNPEGLMLDVLGCNTVDEAQRLLENVSRWTRRRA